MIKKFAFAVLTVFLLVASMGYAANMQVTSSAVPVSGGTITPNGIKFSSTFINYSVVSNPGWSLSSVMIDGVAATGGQIIVPLVRYQVAYDASKVHTIKANFSQNLFSITTSAGIGGTIQVTGGGSTNITPGSSRSVVVTPGSGYKIASLTVDGSPVTPADPTAVYTQSYTNIQANKTVSATFTVIPTATVSAGNNMTVSGTSTVLTGSVTANMTPTAYFWTVTSGPGGSFTNGTTLTPTFNFTALGTYTVTLTATVGGDNFTSSPATITVTTATVSEASVCTSCHAGALQITQWLGSKHATSLLPTAPSCPSCHNPGVLLPHPGYDYRDTTANPGLYYSCSTCHYPGSTKVPSWPPPGLSFHNAYSYTNRCPQCHDPHTTTFNGTMPYPHFSTFSTAQYVTKNNSCDKCHFSTVDSTFNVYSANRQWARSGKGNPKSPAFIGTGPYTEANLEAFDFKFFGTPLPAKPATTTSQDCVRCHTTTGFISYVTPTDSQNPNTAFSNIQAWGTPGDRTREMVACNACHNNTSGFDAGFSRRSVGIETDPLVYPGVYNVLAWYGYSSASTKKIIRTKSYANPAGVNMNDSNLCISCHTGKAAGDLIKLSSNCTTAPSIACRVGTTFWANVDFIDPHNMNTANIMFPDGLKAGYEYRVGTSLTPYHTNIGLETTQGPCVGCHMSSPKKHSYSAISTASNGVIASISTDLCVTCHGVIAMPTDPATLQTKKEGYQAALAVVAAQLAAKGIYYNAAKSPFFFTTSDPAQQTFANRTVNWNYSTTFQGANLIGAAFNLRLLQPGAGWVHNSTYSKRLLYDTIDYLDDGLQNSTVLTAIQNANIDLTVKTKAQAYIGTRP